MKIRCDYCDKYIEDTDELCPFCGAPNAHLIRNATGIPKTIPELQAFCKAHNLPLDQMRFFIDQDYKGAKAFGIYKNENNNFVVYKNKADGTRAIRYEGKDEAYAVNEIYLKLKDEMQKQREFQANKGTPVHHTSAPKVKVNIGKKMFILFAVMAISMAIVVISCFFVMSGPDTGYYSYKGDTYYQRDNDWYIYNNGWVPTTVDPELADHASDYYDSYFYDSDSSYDDFESSDYYEQYNSGSDDDDWDDDSWDDDDWDWDSGSSDWDSGSSDWDSDW